VLFITLVCNFVLTERNVANGKIKKAVRQDRLFKASHCNVRIRIKLLCNAAGDAVQLHAVELAFFHTLRQQAKEIAHATGRFKNVATGKAHALHGLIDSLDDRGAGVVGIEGGSPCKGIFILRKQAL